MFTEKVMCLLPNPCLPFAHFLVEQSRALNLGVFSRGVLLFKLRHTLSCLLGMALAPLTRGVRAHMSEFHHLYKPNILSEMVRDLRPLPVSACLVPKPILSNRMLFIKKQTTDSPNCPTFHCLQWQDCFYTRQA